MKIIKELTNDLPMRDISLIESGDKLFYELGKKIDIDKGYGENWVKIGLFEEIVDVDKYITEDKCLNDADYLEHHNFRIIKKDA